MIGNGGFALVKRFELYISRLPSTSWIGFPETAISLTETPQKINVSLTYVAIYTRTREPKKLGNPSSGQSFTHVFLDCVALPSGSKFIMEHYLPLRILYNDERDLTKKDGKKFRDRGFSVGMTAKGSTTMKNKSIQYLKHILAKKDNIKT